MNRREMVLTVLLLLGTGASRSARAEERRLLYVAEPGIRNYLEHGGHGVLVFDVDHGHKFVKRIPTAGLDEQGKPINVKGVCASARTKRLHVGTIRTVTCLDLVTEKILWEKAYEGGCDRLAVSPDGKTLYVPAFEKGHWNVVDALSGDLITRVDVPGAGSHNTNYGLDGKRAYLAGLNSPWLAVADTSTHKVVKRVGPFSASIRPFTINAKQSLCYVTLNGLLGFEVGDLNTGEKLYRVEVQGYKIGTPKRHGNPSHGIGLTPDETEVWVCDAFNHRMHVFDLTTTPPVKKESILLRDEPGWITFTIDGQYAYPSTGDVIDVKTRKIVTTLADEEGRAVQSEKMVEVDFDGDQPIRTGDQFGVGRRRSD